MPQPNPYNRTYDFTSFQEQFADQPLPAAQVDANLDLIGISNNQVITRLELIQQDDGALLNGVVTLDSLDNTVTALLGSTINPRGNWATVTVYAKLDLVDVSGVSYICAENHTSGTFSTDRDNGKWIVFSNPAADSGVSFFQKFSGDGAVNSFTLTDDLGTDENALMVFYDDGTAHGYQIVLPENLTVNGTSLTTGFVPVLGTDNLIVFSPSKLLGAIAASAAAAEAAKVAAETAQSAAEAAQASAEAVLVDAGFALVSADLAGADTIGTAAANLTNINIVAGDAADINALGPISAAVTTAAGIAASIVAVDADEVDIGVVAGISANVVTVSGISADVTTVADNDSNITICADDIAAIIAAPTEAASAASSAGAAAASAAAALAAVANLAGTSGTSITIGLGSKIFTTQSGKQFNPGQYVQIVSDADPTADFMYGQITAYSGTTLTVDVDRQAGSGAHTDWSIFVSGAGSPLVQWQGAWVTATDYELADVVTDDGATYFCTSAHTSGASTQPGVGGSWQTVWDLMSAAGSAASALLIANNLSDLNNAGTARTNLGVAIGSDVQAHSAVLDATTASFLTADETKLDGIAAGATVNSSDAALVARANHTGTQTMSTISDAGALATLSTVNNSQWSGTGLSIANGGTGASTAAAALAALGGLPLAGGTMSGTLLMADQIIQRAEIRDYGISHTTPNISSGAIAFDCTSSNSFDVDLDENITAITLSNPVGTGRYGEVVIEFVQDATGGRTITGWPASVKWADGVSYAPSATANAIDKVVLSTRDGGATWLGDFSTGYA